jgi:hypothetical protein
LNRHLNGPTVRVLPSLFGEKAPSRRNGAFSSSGRGSLLCTICFCHVEAVFEALSQKDGSAETRNKIAWIWISVAALCVTGTVIKLLAIELAITNRRVLVSEASNDGRDSKYHSSS